jgi:hypothetical protein
MLRARSSRKRLSVQSKSNDGRLWVRVHGLQTQTNDNALKCVMLLLQAKVDEFCLEEKRKLQV